MGKHTILCVDDEIDNVEALERLFRKKYHVQKATSGQEALDWLAHNQSPVALIITDQRMPEMTGVEFLEKTLDLYPETSRILLTGYTDLESVIAAVNKGQIYRYLTKPWDPVDLAQTVDSAVEKFQLHGELQIKNRELSQALEELKTLDEAKTQFMILINHELKTPLTSILNFTDLLKETKIDSEQKKYLQRIETNSQKLKDLVDDVLLIMKAETGQLQAKGQSIVASQLVQKSIEKIQDSLEKKNQIVQQKVNIEKFQGDEVFLQQVLQRLLHNASKFGLEGTSLQISAEKKSGAIRWTISNDGPLIPEAAIDRIFRPFHIEENALNHTTGLGLGLTVSQSLLKMMNSSLHLKNDAKGVSVSFDLPQ